MLAWPATVDAGVFLTHEGEKRAIIRGRQTWLYVPGPPRRIWVRDKWNRRGARAGQLKYGRPTLVVVEHVCYRPTPEWAKFSHRSRIKIRVGWISEPPF